MLLLGDSGGLLTEQARKSSVRKLRPLVGTEDLAVVVPIERFIGRDAAIQAMSSAAVIPEFTTQRLAQPIGAAMVHKGAQVTRHR